jgi:hypothetical protein
MEQSGAPDGASLRAERIGAQGYTRGSETSQYPEEKKTTVIPQVVASERGTAQTGGPARRGCGTGSEGGRAGGARDSGKCRRGG